MVVTVSESAAKVSRKNLKIGQFFRDFDVFCVNCHNKSVQIRMREL
jgi:hypothetical protein